MSADDLPRVTMPIYQGTDPTAGGNFDATHNFFPDFYPHARVQSGTDVLPATLMGLIRQR